MKHLAIIQKEFLKEAREWRDLTLEEQKGYLGRHPKTKRRIFRRKEDQLDKGDRIFWAKNKIWGWVKKLLSDNLVKIQSDDSRTFYDVPFDELIKTANIQHERK